MSFIYYVMLETMLSKKTVPYQFYWISWKPVRHVDDRSHIILKELVTEGFQNHWNDVYKNFKRKSSDVWTSWPKTSPSKPAFYNPSNRFETYMVVHLQHEFYFCIKLLFLLSRKSLESRPKQDLNLAKKKESFISYQKWLLQTRPWNLAPSGMKCLNSNNALAQNARIIKKYATLGNKKCFSDQKYAELKERFKILWGGHFRTWFIHHSLLSNP